MSFVALVIVVTCMAMSTFHYWHREAEQRSDASAQRAFFVWLAQGLGGPMLVWTFFNCGLFVSPLIPSIAQAHAAGNWAGAFFRGTAAALFIVASWWAAVTLGWVAWRVVENSEEKISVLPTAGVWLACALPIAGIIVIASGSAGLGFALALCMGASAHGMLLFRQPKVGPSYSRALAKIAFDKFNDAEWEIIKQLEEQGNDFDGWMLLAELYATHFKDLPSAERTICELCDDPGTTPPQISIALNRLADWYLKLDGNPDNARWALDQICTRLPDTHMARMAQARMAQLPATREEWSQQRKGKTIRLKVQPDPGVTLAPQTNLDEGAVESSMGSPCTVKLAPRSAPIDTKDAAMGEAMRLKDVLTNNPDDMEARVKFARVLAEALGKADAAIEQLELLARMPAAAEAQRQEWLALQADWHLKLRQDQVQGRLALERIAREFPQSHAAFEAQRRLYVLELETAARQRRRSAQIGR